MELGLGNTLMAAGDPRLIDHIVGEVKSQGIFDKFRKECLADVDTKPAYQNLRTRVEGSVNSFLNKQTWRTDLNKNQLRETLRKHIQNAPYLEVGVERIVDQVVNPKIYSVFMPQIEDVVYKFLGIERPKPQRNGACDLKDLLPKDLDPVSESESEKNSVKDESFEFAEENTTEPANQCEQKPSSSSFDEKSQDLESSFKKEDIVKNKDLIKNEEFIKKEELIKKEEPIKKEELTKKEDFIKKEENVIEKYEEVSQVEANSSAKAVVNNSFKSDELNKTEEEEEDSPVFEPIDAINLNESNMSNDSHLSGISELTSHRSRSPDFTTEFSRDNFDCSNQDSQLSKVSSNSRLSIVTDFGSSNHASTPLPESKDDSKGAKDSFKAVREFDSNKDNKFNFDMIKSKEQKESKTSSSKENSRDASDYKESRNKEESSSKSKSSRDKYDSKNSRDRDRDSRRRRSSKSDKYPRSKDKNESESQDSKENYNRSREAKPKELEKKDDPSKEARDLKDLYKEKIRELREKKELTEKEKLSKDTAKPSKDKESRDKKDSSYSREKDDSRRGHKSSSSSSSRSSSYYKSTKGSRDRSSSSGGGGKRDERRHSNGRSGNNEASSKGNSHANKRDGKSESSRRDRKQSARRDEKKPKSSSSTDDHSSLRTKSNERRSSDRDGSNGSSSRYSHKSSYGSGPGASGRLESGAPAKEHYSATAAGEPSDRVHDVASLDNPPRRVDPGAAEICLPLKKRPLHGDESSSSSGESPRKKSRPQQQQQKKPAARKIGDVFKSDTDLTNVPDEERVQIIEIPDEDYEQPYPSKEPILSLEETKNIIFNAEPINPVPSKLSEMEQSIRDSLNEMMSDHGGAESENVLSANKLVPVIDSTSSLLETLTDESNNDLEFSLVANSSATAAAAGLDVDKENSTAEPEVEETSTLVAPGGDGENEEENIKSEIQKMYEDARASDDEAVDSENRSQIIAENVEEEDSTGKSSGNAEGGEEKVNENVGVDGENTVHSEKFESVKENVGRSEWHTKGNVQDENNEKTKENIELDVSKNEMDTTGSEENIEKDIVDETTKSKRSSVDDSEKFDVAIKDFTDNPERRNNDSSDTEVDRSMRKHMRNTYQDEDSADYTDEFNEDKLVIDEEFDGKRNDNEAQGGPKVNFKCNEEDNDDKMMIDSGSSAIDNEDAAEAGENEKKDKLIESIEKINNSKENDEDMIENTEDKVSEAKIPAGGNDEKSTEIAENKQKNEKSFESSDNVVAEQMTGQLISESNELGSDGKDTKKSIEDEEDDNNSRDDGSFEEFKENERSAEEDEDSFKLMLVDVSVDETLKTDKEEVTREKSHNDILTKSKVDEDAQSSINEENEDDKPTISVERHEELEETDAEVTALATTENASTATDVKEEIEGESSHPRASTSKESVGPTARARAVVSPVEEDCYYFESDNRHYLTFKRFLEKLEADPSRSLEDMVESFGGRVIPCTRAALAPGPTAAPRAATPEASTGPTSVKRKLTPSPLAHILAANSDNNNDDGNVKQPGSLEEQSQQQQQTPSEDCVAVVVAKKRKPGRLKKVTPASGSASCATPPPHSQLQQQQQLEHQLLQTEQTQMQPEQQQQHEQQQQQQQQQAQATTIVNGENIIFPLNLDDVSGDKNVTLKDEKGRHRSKQRYSSDDLYKPRPLFSSSSRRNRRFNNNQA